MVKLEPHLNVFIVKIRDFFQLVNVDKDIVYIMTLMVNNIAVLYQLLMFKDKEKKSNRLNV